MKRVVFTAVLLLSTAALWAQSQPREWLEGVSQALGKRYATHITVLADDISPLSGYFVVDGDSYYLTLGSMEVYSDGDVRYEVNNDRKEVVEDVVDLQAKDILTNPTRAFDFLSDSYQIDIVESYTDGAKIKVQPKDDVADVVIYVVVKRSGERVLPRSITYDYDGDSYAVSLDIINESMDVPKWDKTEYRAYDIVSFL